MNPEIIQSNGSYAITLEFASGLVGEPFLDAINRIVKQEGARIHLTTSQKIMILDLSEESAGRAREILNELVTFKSCGAIQTNAIFSK
jgi:dissimilatory sulfite reductase (desulfoviridin) alpha/beta subunit